MAGDIFFKDQSPVALTTISGTLANNTAVLVAAINLLTTSGTANLALNFEATAELLAQWSTITGITVRVVVADLYFVPAVDGTNYADVDTTSGSSFISSNYRVGSFVAHKQLVTATNYRFATAPFDLFPLKYNVYLLNVSGQTMSASGIVTLAAARNQYT